MFFIQSVSDCSSVVHSTANGRNYFGRTMSGRLNKLGFYVSLTIATLVALLATTAFSATPANAATINTCGQAIAALNRQLPVVAKRKISLREAKATRNTAKINKAQRRYTASRKTANRHRSMIRQLCTTSGVAATNAACFSSIETYSTKLNTLATRSYQLKKVKGNSARAKKRRRTLKTQIRKLSSDVRKDSKSFEKACSSAVGSSGQPGTGNTPPAPTPNNNFNDPTTTVDCTPGQFAATLGCTTGVPSINIPSFPNGLSTNYQVSIDGEVTGLCSVSGLAPFYTLLIVVDGAIVASDTGGGFVQTNCNPTIDIDALITGLTLSPTIAHRISLRVKTSILLPANPSTTGGSMTADIAQL